MFGREAPIIVEIGSGVGEATATLAAARPSYDIVALEVWRPGVAHTLGLLGRGRRRPTCGCSSVDAVWCLEHLFGPGEVEELWTFFPDPWPKKRHHKRRLVNAEFAALVASRLRVGGVWRLATDWGDYAAQMRTVLDAETDARRGRGAALGGPAGHQVRAQGRRRRTARSPTWPIAGPRVLRPTHPPGWTSPDS